jgi:hypothetical protein
MQITSKMLALLGEEEVPKERIAALLPQLVLAMDAIGLDPKDEMHQEVFIGILKQLSTNKSALLKAMKTFSGAKATKAVKAAKASL